MFISTKSAAVAIAGCSNFQSLPVPSTCLIDGRCPWYPTTGQSIDKGNQKVATVAQVLAHAWQRHQAGDFLTAEKLYRMVLEADAACADAWCLLGAACDALGRVAEAQVNYRRAIQLKPHYAAAHYNLGLALEHEGKLGEAAGSYLEALRLQPDNIAALLNLGNVQKAQGDLGQAIACYRKVLHLQPDYAEVRVNLGNALAAQNKPEQAMAEWRAALRLRPDLPEVHANVGKVLAEQGKLDDAIACYSEALRLNPAFAEAHNGLGYALERQNKLEEAVQSYGAAIRHQANFAEAYNNLGNALGRQEKVDAAVECYREALRINPVFAEAHNGLGHALEQLDKLDEAIGCYRHALGLRANFAEAWNNLGKATMKRGMLADADRYLHRALDLKPGFVEAHTNLGSVFMLEGRPELALASFQEALRADPASGGAHWNSALMRLLLGDFAKGWPGYEWRWTQRGYVKRHQNKTLWDGSDLGGRTIVLYVEQGLGDTLQFIRYAPLVKERGGKVIVECEPQLLRLLAGVAGIDQLVAEGSPLPAFDFQVPLLTLPGIFQTSLETVPKAVPYLHADTALVEHWRRQFADFDPQWQMSRDRHPEPGSGRIFRVGIAWQGNPAYGYDRYRSIPLSFFGRLAKVQGVRLVSLQKGPGVEQLAALAGRFPVLDLGNRLDEESGPFMDTAAIMMSLDLVISSDTAVAHLAGGLGVPVWIALATVPEWRWLLKRSDCPWYPTMQLFRQEQQGDWEGLFKRIAGALDSAVAATGGKKPTAD